MYYGIVVDFDVGDVWCVVVVGFVVGCCVG